jgi:hypothetical protein
MGAVPGQPLLREAIERLRKPVKTRDGMGVVGASGPGFLSALIFEKRNLLTESDVIFPSSYFYPAPNFMKLDGVSYEQLKGLVRGWSFAVHYWETNWLRPPWWKMFLSRCKKLLLSALKRLRTDAA